MVAPYEIPINFHLYYEILVRTFYRQKSYNLWETIIAQL